MQSHLASRLIVGPALFRLSPLSFTPVLSLLIAVPIGAEPLPRSQRPDSARPDTARPGDDKNQLEDPSFEITKPRDQFGNVFAKWGGWKYEGECDFRVGQVARTGKHSMLLFGGAAPKIRVSQDVELDPGRYKITAYLRGLDIGTGTWGMTTEFMFNGNYVQLKKNGTFGWTKLTYVGQIQEKKKAGPSFGLMAPGYLWIDDASLVKAGKQFGMKFRISWHWNIVAGDPYYALDCREDDYAWRNSSPDGRLVPAVHFEQLREGLDDYRRLITLARLSKEKAGTPAARAAQELIDARMAAFKLGQREHDQLFPPSDWTEFRRKVDDAIEALRK